MKKRHFALLVIVALLVAALPAAGQSDSVQTLIKTIKAVGKEGKGNVEAGKAVGQLTKLGPAALNGILAALDDANPVAANYLRAAAETIADHALKAKKELPLKELEQFALDTKHAGHARKLAFDLLIRADAKAEERLLPGMLDDPGPELRRAAVARVLKEAQQLFDAKDAKAKAAYQKALGHARDYDQVRLIADRLKELGTEVDLARHFGFIHEWMIVGPFDSSGGIGYKTAYPPEMKVDLAATYTGKGGKEVKWQKYLAPAVAKPKELFELGHVDFNKAFGDLKGVVGYAYTVVQSDKERPVEIRAASNNAVQIFLNGKKVFGREEYHHGVETDMHVGKGVLKAGANQILVKVLQNEQTEKWAELWSFQLRITDHLGTPVPVTVALDKGAPKGGE